MIKRLFLTALLLTTAIQSIAFAIDYSGDYQEGSSNPASVTFNTYEDDGSLAETTGLTVYLRKGATTVTDAETLTENANSIDGYHEVSIDLTNAGIVPGDWDVMVSAGTRVSDSLPLAGNKVGKFSVGRYANVATDEDGGVSLADGAITAPKIGADAFTATKFASDVTTELQAGLATGSDMSTLLSRLSSARAGYLDFLNIGGNVATSGDVSAVYGRLGAPVGATISADIAAKPTAAQIRTEMDSNSTKLANLDAAVSTRATNAGAASAVVAEQPPEAFFENAPSGGEAEIDRADADMIAARVNAHRGTFYPNEKQVWVLKRGTAGLEVKNSFQISKGAGETIRVYIDFASVMGRNEFVESIAELALSGGTATIVADSQGIVGNLVYFDVTGGAADDTTTVEFEVLSTEDQTISGDVCEFNVVE